MNYYRRYSGDYLRKTGKLSMLEHGAYTLLLDYYYTDEEPLPGDREEIYRLVRAMTPADRKAVDKVLDRYFELRDGVYHNARADEELAIAQPAIEASRSNGRKGGRPSKAPNGNPTKNPDSNLSGNPPGYDIGKPGRLEAGIQPPSSNHQPPAFTPEPLPDGNGRASATPPSRAVAIAVLLRKAEQDRGKVPRITSTDPRVQAWAAANVTDDELREAHALAVADRGTDPSPINAGFLDLFVAKLRNPSAGASRVGAASAPLDWWASPAGIFAKAEAEGVEVAMRHNGDELVRDALVTRARLCAKLGEGADDRDATLTRLIREERERAAA